MFESFALFQSDLDKLGAGSLEMELEKQHSPLLPLLPHQIGPFGP